MNRQKKINGSLSNYPYTNGFFTDVMDHTMIEHKSEDILHTCPPPIPERKGQRHTFLESVLQAHDVLTTTPTTTSAFLNAMLVWAGREPQKSNRYLQNVLDAYYLIGVIPHINLSKEKYRVISSCLVQETDLHGLRLYCLGTFFTHLARNDVFWSCVVSHAPICISKLYEQLKPLDEVTPKNWTTC